MRRIALVLAALMLALTVTACGKEAEPTHEADSFSCPTDNTRAFPKVRFVADLGLAFGSFKHWIYTPYKEGKFEKGADGRTLALVKAGGAALLTAHLLKNASENVKADPTLCGLVGKPVAQLADATSNLKSKIVHGDFGSLTSIFASVTSLSALMNKSGNPVKESFNQ